MSPWAPYPRYKKRAPRHTCHCRWVPSTHKCRLLLGMRWLNITPESEVDQLATKRVRISAPTTPTTPRTHLQTSTPARGRPAYRLQATTDSHKRSQRLILLESEPAASKTKSTTAASGTGTPTRPHTACITGTYPLAPPPPPPPRATNTSTDTSDDTPSVTPPQVPLGLVVSPHQVTMVWSWWNNEIAPWSRIILGAGGHEALSHPWKNGSTSKKGMTPTFTTPPLHPPPPIVMWLDQIFNVTSPQATDWFKARDIREAMGEWSHSFEDQV